MTIYFYMWILRFHTLETRDYNMISRKLEKADFSGRKISGILFIKSSLEHILLKKSWRSISKNLSCSHLALYNLYQKMRYTPEYSEIIFTLAKRRIILNIKGKKQISENDLLNNEDILRLTLDELKDIVPHI